MFAEKFIRRIVSSKIRQALEGIIQSPKVLDDSVDYLTDLVMEFVAYIGFREFIQIIWYARKKQNIQRVVMKDPHPELPENTDATEDS